MTSLYADGERTAYTYPVSYTHLVCTTLCVKAFGLLLTTPQRIPCAFKKSTSSFIPLYAFVLTQQCSS